MHNDKLPLGPRFKREPSVKRAGWVSWLCLNMINLGKRFSKQLIIFLQSEYDTHLEDWFCLSTVVLVPFSSSMFLFLVVMPIWPLNFCPIFEPCLWSVTAFSVSWHLTDLCVVHLLLVQTQLCGAPIIAVEGLI